MTQKPRRWESVISQLLTHTQFVDLYSSFIHQIGSI